MIARPLLAALALCMGCVPVTAAAQTPIKFALDWRFEGPAAPYFERSTKATTRPKGWM